MFADKSDVLFVQLLHAILPPNIKYCTTRGNGKKIVIKSTIKDSQNEFIIHAVAVNDVDHKIEELKQILLKREQTLQPVIVVVGCSLTELNEFYLQFDNIKYKFDHFLPALDCCFKIFHILNLQYSNSCANVWTFIQKYFYEISLPNNKLCSSILCLLSELA